MKNIRILIIVLLIAISLPATAALKNDSLVVDKEATLLIEDWMFFELNPSQEAIVTLEGWMFTELDEAPDVFVEMESWMFEALTPHQESEFAIESWMLESLYPEDTEETEDDILEDWMFKPLK